MHETLTRARKAQRDPSWKQRYRATRPKVERNIAHPMRRRHGVLFRPKLSLTLARMLEAAPLYARTRRLVAMVCNVARCRTMRHFR